MPWHTLINNELLDYQFLKYKFLPLKKKNMIVSDVRLNYNLHFFSIDEKKQKQRKI